MFIPFASPGFWRNSSSAFLAFSLAVRARSKPSSDRPPALSDAVPSPLSSRPFDRSAAFPTPPSTPPAPRPPMPGFPEGRPPPPPLPRPWALALMQAPKINNETRPRHNNLTECLDFIKDLHFILSDLNLKGGEI